MLSNDNKKSINNLSRIRESIIESNKDSTTLLDIEMVEKVAKLKSLIRLYHNLDTNITLDQELSIIYDMMKELRVVKQALLWSAHGEVKDLLNLFLVLNERYKILSEIRDNPQTLTLDRYRESSSYKTLSPIIGNACNDLCNEYFSRKEEDLESNNQLDNNVKELLAKVKALNNTSKQKEYDEQLLRKKQDIKSLSHMLSIIDEYMNLNQSSDQATDLATYYLLTELGEDMKSSPRQQGKPDCGNLSRETLTNLMNRGVPTEEIKTARDKNAHASLFSRLPNKTSASLKKLLKKEFLPGLKIILIDEIAQLNDSIIESNILKVESVNPELGKNFRENFIGTVNYINADYFEENTELKNT